MGRNLTRGHLVAYACFMKVHIVVDFVFAVSLMVKNRNAVPFSIRNAVKCSLPIEDDEEYPSMYNLHLKH